MPSWFAQNQPTDSRHQIHDSSSRCKAADLLLEANWGKASWRKTGEREGGKEGERWGGRKREGEGEREGEKERERERKGEQGTLADWWAGWWLCYFRADFKPCFSKMSCSFGFPGCLLDGGHNS